MNTFLRACKTLSVLSVNAHIVFKFLACLVPEKNKFNVSA